MSSPTSNLVFHENLIQATVTFLTTQISEKTSDLNSWHRELSNVSSQIMTWLSKLSQPSILIIFFDRTYLRWNRKSSANQVCFALLWTEDESFLWVNERAWNLGNARIILQTILWASQTREQKPKPTSELIFEISKIFADQVSDSGFHLRLFCCRTCAGGPRSETKAARVQNRSYGQRMSLKTK